MSRILPTKLFESEDEGMNIGMNLASPKQWSKLLYDVQQRYVYYEDFHFRLPHFNNKFVKGIGMKDSVLKCYADLSQLGIIGKVDINSYQVIEPPQSTIPSIPKGHLVVFIPENLSGLVYAGYEDYRKVFPIEQVTG